jgi:DNA-binding transcriptional regulator YiaG
MSTTAQRSSPPPAARADAGSAALTGADVAAFRRGAGLNQVAAAQRLGVTQGTISKAEGNPRTVLGPALHDALRRAAG